MKMPVWLGGARARCVFGVVPSPTMWSTLSELEGPLGHIRPWDRVCLML